MNIFGLKALKLRHAWEHMPVPISNNPQILKNISNPLFQEQDQVH